MVGGGNQRDAANSKSSTPRARFERATYCLGDRRPDPPDLVRCRSEPMWHARERP
jgi:hypothetical protein